MQSVNKRIARYKSLRICDISMEAIFPYRKRYALRGARGFISYRIGAKRQYIARAKRVYRVCLQTYRPTEKRDNISDTNRFVISFCLYMGLGLAHLHLTGQMRCSHLAVFSNSPLRTSPISRSIQIIHISLTNFARYDIVFLK